MAKDRKMNGVVARSRYRTARVDLLLLIILTVVNIALLLGGAETIMLFSAFMPYCVVAIAFYNGPSWFLQGSLIFAAVLLAAYLLCWIFSKRHYGWMIGALVLFAVDTLAVVIYYWGMWSYGIIDLLIHLAVLYYLSVGVRCGHFLRHAPEAAMAPEPIPIENTAPKRQAEGAPDDCILAQAQTQIGFICYRNVDQVYELVINGFVYDEVELLVETTHELRAIYDGHLVQAGLVPGSAIRYIQLDGQQIAHHL